MVGALAGLVVLAGSATTACAGGRSPAFLNSLTTEVDPYSGSSSLAVPIAVPSGRGGIQPNVALSYNSGQHNGVAGVGWSLELGAIVRSTKWGVPNYDSSDSFVMTMPQGTSELVYDNSAGYYRPEIEGAFMKIEFINGSYWQATDKNGTKYIFGSDDLSQEYNPVNTGHVFKWCLNRVEDVHGNYMAYFYRRHGNVLYPSSISYTGNSTQGETPYALVEFEYDTTRTDGYSNYLSGFSRHLGLLLRTITTRAAGTLERSYSFAYTSSTPTNRNLLQKVTQTGADGTALPAMTLEYQGDGAVSYQTRVVTGQNSGGKSFVDYNGDGYADIGTFVPDQGQYRVSLASSSGTFASPTSWISGIGSTTQILMGHFDRDGRVDLCIYNTSRGEWNAALSSGSQFVGKGVWLTDFGVNQRPGTGDINGDGLTDVYVTYTDGSGTRIRIALNKGGSFAATGGADPVLFSAGTGDVFNGDFNGDGLTDFALFDGMSGTWSVKLNRGKLTDFELIPTVTGFGGGDKPVLADFNIDGMTDIGYYDSVNAYVHGRLSNGSSFNGTVMYALGVSSRGAGYYAQSADFNADGITDWGVYNDAGQIETATLQGGKQPDLMSRSQNGIGGVMTLTYAPSSQFSQSFLPFTVPVVSAVTQSNSRGEAYTTNYTYTGGVWNAPNKEFWGFGTVKVTDPDGNYSETHFLQDAIYKGRIKDQASYDSNAKLYGKTVYTWAAQTIVSGVNFVYLKRKDNYVYDGDSTGKRTAEEFYFEETPQRGNLTKAVQLGEVNLSDGSDITGDSRTVETTYASNTTGGKWLLGLPRQVVVKDTSGTIVRQSWLDYDNQSNTTAPVQGLLTKKEEWAGSQTGSVNPMTRYTYDVFGNLVSTKDPAANNTGATTATATVSYDTKYHLFPLTTQNALGHTVVNTYYGINGVALKGSDGTRGLWGQLKSTTDPNAETGTSVYDEFGRQTTLVGPMDSLSYPTKTVEYAYGSDHSRITARQRINNGQAGTIDSVSFSDGLGRGIQGKSPMETSGQYAVSGQSEYNSRGLPRKKYLTFSSTNGMTTMDAITTTRPAATMEYDAMGRMVRSVNPDGTYASVGYSDWTTTAVDENGHQQKSTVDAYGRLVKKEEYTGADGRSPTYPASAFTLYATTQYSYDSESNLVKTTDAQGHVTTISYDNLGRKVSMNDPDMGVWTYAYDVNGNLTRQIDAKGQTMTFIYDVLNRLKNKTDGGNLNVNYTYDDPYVTKSKGRLTKAGYGTNDQTTFAYDSLGREKSSQKQIDQLVYNVERGYDGLSRLNNVMYPDEGKVTYTYNSGGQIETVSGSFEETPQVPTAPVVSSAQGGVGTVTLVWGAVANATGYKVKHGTTSGSYTTTVDAGNVTTYQVTGLSYAVKYYFVVTAYNASGESGNSKELSATTDSPTPGKPTLNTPGIGSQSLSLSWGSVSGATGYKIKHGTATGSYTTTVDAKNVTSYTLSGLTNGTKYYVVVSAYNTWKDGAVSNEVSGTPAVVSYQTITVNANMSSSFTNTSTGTIQFGVDATKTNRMLVASIVMKDATVNPAPTTVTYAGQALTKITRKERMVGTTYYAVEMWYLVNPLAGTNSFSASFNTTVDSLRMGTSALSGVRQGAPETFAAVSGTGTTSTVSLTTITPNALVMDTFMDENGYVNSSKGANQIEWWRGSNGADMIGIGSYKKVTTASTTTMSWTLASSINYAQIAAAFAPASTQSAALRISEEAPRYANVFSIPSHIVGRFNIPSTGFARRVREGGNTILSSISRASAELADMLFGVFSVTTAEAQTAQTAVNYTTFTEADPTSKITVATSAISFTNIESNNTNAYVYTPRTTNGDFKYEFDVLVSGGDSNSQPVLAWGVTNTPAKTINTWTDGIYVAVNKFGSLYTINLNSLSNSYTFTSGCVVGTKYYVRVKRSGTTVTMEVYKDAARTVLYDTRTRTNSGNYTYLYGFSAMAGGGNNFKITGSVNNLTVQSSVAKPSAPVLNTPTAGDKSVSLSWAAVTNATGYKVKYSSTKGSYSTVVTLGNVTSTKVTGLTNGTAYYFVATATNTAGESGNSTEVSSTPKVSVPTAPVLNTPTAGDASVTLSWAAVTNATGYKVKYGMTKGSYPTVVTLGNVTSTKVTGLTNGTTYYFVATATNTSGESGNSTEVSAAPKAPPATAVIKGVDYNVHGQVTKITYGNGTVTTHTYNSLNLRLERILTVDASNAKLQDLNYAYDSAGNIISITDNVNTATQSFQYDALNRLTKAAGQTYGTKTFTYDTIGNITAKDDKTYSYGENGAGPHAVTSLSDGSTFTYDANGNMTLRVESGVTTAYTYDAENRLTEVSKSDALIAQYSYDGDGGRTKKTVYSATTTTSNTCFLAGTRVMMADGTSKSIEEIHAGDEVRSFNEKTGQTVNSKVTMFFDAERTKDYLVLNNGLRVTANHLFYSKGEWREIGKLSTADTLLGLELTDAGIESIEKIRLEDAVPVYNIEVDQYHNYFVLSQSNGNGNGEEGYLVHNKLAFGTTSATASVGTGVTTTYVGSLSEETSGRTTNYIFLGGTRVASETNGKLMYYHPDHLGGTNVLTDSTGSKKELIEYEPFGSYAKHEKYGSTEEVAYYYFTGKPLDDESGLFYFGARYYDPSLGRFITADAVVQDPYNPQTLNRYSYTSNNPINRIDPDGHRWSWKKFWKSFAGAFVSGLVTVMTGNPLLGAMTGGALSGGLNGGWSGALIGGTQLGIFGGIVGWARTGNYQYLLGATFPGAIYLTARNDSWDSFAGGLTGGLTGASVGNGIDSYFHDPLSVKEPAGGVRNESVVEGRGVGTTPDKALQVANETGSRVVYTQSRGTVSDIIRGGMQLVFKNSLASRQFAQFMLGNPNTTYNLHSEMTLTALGAAKMLKGNQVGGRFNLVSPFYSKATAESVFGGIGATANWVPPHLADSAGMFTTLNPVTAPIYGTLGVVTLEHFHGYKTYQQNNN